MIHPISPMTRLHYLLILISVATAVGARAADDLVRNGGFEQDANRDDAADFWFVHHSTDTTPLSEGSVSWITDEPAPEGRAFLRVSKTEGSRPFSVNQIITDEQLSTLGVSHDTPLLLRASIRAHELSGTATVVLRIFRNNENDAPSFVAGISAQPAVTSGDTWQHVETKLRLDDILAPGETLHRIEIALVVSSNTGHADFDAVSLIPAD